MRKEYGAALRKVFIERLAQVCPDFIPARQHIAPARFPGERAYCCRVSDTVYHWVVLIPDQKREAFFVELGWSRSARFPQLTMRPSAARPGEAGSENEYLCRLGVLAGRNDFGFVVEELPLDATQDAMMAYILAQTQPLSPELAQARVAPRVEDALRELVQHGLPFLRMHT